jgi:ribosomal protein L1
MVNFDISKKFLNNQLVGRLKMTLSKRGLMPSVSFSSS